MTLQITPPSRNIVVCGRTGAGKSSLINLILGEEKAPISHYGGACTLEAMRYTTTIESQQFNIVDTVGHNEPKTSQQRERLFETIVNTYELLASLATAGGVHLLVFCFRAGRLTEATRRTYSLFHDFMCDGRVPAVLVVTHLEYLPSMDAWWENPDNQKEFFECEIRPKATACVTTLSGQSGSEQRQKYDQSRMKVHELLQRYALTPVKGVRQRGVASWTVNSMHKLGTMLETMRRFQSPRYSTKSTVRFLTDKASMTKEDAEKLAQLLNGIDLRAGRATDVDPHDERTSDPATQNIWDLDEERETERKLSVDMAYPNLPSTYTTLSTTSFSSESRCHIFRLPQGTSQKTEQSSNMEIVNVAGDHAKDLNNVKSHVPYTVSATAFLVK